MAYNLDFPSWLPSENQEHRSPMGGAKGDWDFGFDFGDRDKSGLKLDQV